MIITLNEYTLALLCGGVSCLTYVVIHLNDIDENKLTKNTDDKKSTTFANDITPSTSELSSRRQSQLAARFRSQRAESVKNDHVVFADEFNEQDQKFAPHIDHMEEESEVPRFYFAESSVANFGYLKDWTHNWQHCIKMCNVVCNDI